MVKISRFAHFYDLGDSIAIYHSLRMRPVFLLKEVYNKLQNWLNSSFSDSISNLPSDIKMEVNELIKAKILTQSYDEDDKVFEFVKSNIPTAAISVCYMILTEQCNLACKYCFLGNNDSKKRELFSKESMSIDTADKAIDFFIHQLKISNVNEENCKPVLIFYGGEPLINFSVLEYIATKVNNLSKKEKILKNIEMSVVTNGVLLDESKIKSLNKLGVNISISIDGFTKESNNLRVDVNNKPVFSDILKVLDKCKLLGVNVSLSVTITEETIKNKLSVLELLNMYSIKSFGFNIMMSSDTFTLSNSYNEAAAQFIIDIFIELRKLGIYEDRIMRKLNSFSKAQIYFSDCAATSGAQIVIAPNGEVGVCHGCLHDKKYFVSHINDKNFNAITNETFIEWAKLIPMNNENCISCPALGICGGGCPINAMYLGKNNTIHSIDERFCIHSKKTLEFFIKDLYRIVSQK